MENPPTNPKTIKKGALIAVGIIVLIGLIIIGRDIFTNTKEALITNFEECAAAGNPIMESYPEQCRTPDGRLFVHDIGTSTPDLNPPADSNPGTVAKACKPTGCSGQICADEDMASTCEYREEYACYQSAICKRQASGECGWTETSELKACIDKARAAN